MEAEKLANERVITNNKADLRINFNYEQYEKIYNVKTVLQKQKVGDEIRPFK